MTKRTAWRLIRIVLRPPDSSSLLSTLSSISCKPPVPTVEWEEIRSDRRQTREQIEQQLNRYQRQNSSRLHEYLREHSPQTMRFEVQVREWGSWVVHDELTTRINGRFEALADEPLSHCA